MPTRPHSAAPHSAAPYSAAPLLAFAAFASLVACGGRPAAQPCTECPDVGGFYEETVFATPAERSTCRGIYSHGWTSSITVVQEGSLVTAFGPQLLEEPTATLLEDLTIAFNAVRAYTNQGDPGMAYLAGVFVPDGERYRFEGSYNFVRDSDHCRVSLPAKWQRK